MAIIQESWQKNLGPDVYCQQELTVNQRSSSKSKDLWQKVKQDNHYLENLAKAIKKKWLLKFSGEKSSFLPFQIAAMRQ